MVEQSYLIAVDAVNSSTDVAAIKNYIKQEAGFTHWWNHLPAVFLVTSRLTADQITDRLRPVAGDASFLVIGVRLDETEGWLPSRSWNWIRHREREVGGTDAQRLDQTADDHAGGRTHDA